jgi:hypothetical protein
LLVVGGGGGHCASAENCVKKHQRITFFREADLSFFLSKQTYFPTMVRREKRTPPIEDIIDHGDHSVFLQVVHGK